MLRAGPVVRDAECSAGIPAAAGPTSAEAAAERADSASGPVPASAAEVREWATTGAASIDMVEERSLHPPRWWIRLPSSTDQLPHLRKRLRRLLRPLGLTDSMVHDIVLSTHEAVVNGMSHGNRLDPCKEVLVTVEFDDQGVVIEVADEGPGFDWRSWLQRLQRHRLDPQALEGRGLLLVSRLMDGVWFSDAGNVIRLTKRLGDAVP